MKNIYVETTINRPKAQNGITVIALIVTIIVMLILAGVTINMVVGQNGIFTKATAAKEATRKKEAEEEIRMLVLEEQTDKLGQATLGDIVEALKKDSRYTYIVKYSPTASLSSTEGDIQELESDIAGAIGSRTEIYVTHKGYEFLINGNMQVTLIRKIGEMDSSTPATPVVSKNTYTITRSLNNAISNNSKNTIQENAVYTEIITASSGYSIKSVTVTMGGIDITGEAYNNGMVTIRDVTANIEVNVVAERILLNAKIVAENPRVYYGKSVNYQAGGQSDWRIFYSDGNNIYITTKAIYISIKSFSTYAEYVEYLKSDGKDFYSTMRTN